MSGRDVGAVLVTGVGGAAGVAVIQALRGKRAVVAVDSDPDAVGLALVTDSAVVPRGDHPDFAVHIAKLANRFGATALVSTVAEEMEALQDGVELLTEAGLRSWLPTVPAIRACTDKWLFAQTCGAAGVPIPATALDTVAGVPGPWIVKPRFGRGSRDIYSVDTVAEVCFALGRMTHPLVQTRLTGREFTVDALVDRDGTLAGAVPRWRLEIKAGISTKARTFRSPRLVAAVTKVLSAVGLTGPANVQGFHSDDGEITFTEVNPRFSGGLPLALAAGADMVGEYLRGVAGEQVRPARLVAEPGVTMLRHFAEVYRR